MELMRILRLAAFVLLLALGAACSDPGPVAPPPPTNTGSVGHSGGSGNGNHGGNRNDPTPVPRAALLPESPTSLPAFTFLQYRTLLGQLEGTPVVVNVWASWCGPCREEAPVLARAARAYEGRVQFLGVDIQDQRSPARSFVNEFGWIYPSVFDAPGDIKTQLGFLGQPDTLFYDASGRLISTWQGPLTPEILDQRIRRIA